MVSAETRPSRTPWFAVLAALALVLLLAALLLRKAGADGDPGAEPRGSRLAAENPHGSRGEPGILSPMPSSKSAPSQNPEVPPKEELKTLLRWCGEAFRLGRLLDGPQFQRLLALLNEQGREALLDLVEREKDPDLRWAALSAVCSMLSLDGKPLRSMGSYGWVETADSRFADIVKSLALDASLSLPLRTLAVQAIHSLPVDRAEPLLDALLRQAELSEALRVTASYTRPLPESLRNLALQRAVEVLADPGTENRARGAAVEMFRNDPAMILLLLERFPQEPSTLARRLIALESARFLAEEPALPSAPELAGRLFELALSSDDPGVQQNIVQQLGRTAIRDRFGDAALKTILALTEKGEEELRVASIRALADGRYGASTDKLRALSADPSPRIAQEAQAALRRLSP